MQELPRDVQTSLNNLVELMSSKRNHKTYRDAIHQMSPPRIPYLGLMLTDLVFVDEGNPDNIKTKENVFLINWDKRERIADIIQEIQKYQQVPYNFAKVHQISVLLQQMKGKLASDEALMAISIEREPKGHV